MRVRFTEIRKRRLAKGLTLAAAAKLAGLKRAQNWKNVESGLQGHNLKLNTILGICKALDCRIDDVVSY